MKTAALACIGLLVPVAASAQLGNPSTAAFGVGGNVTAHAQELAAISANPAGLAMPGSGFSFALLPVRVRSGLGPITLADLVDFEGRLVPPATKDEWLAQVQASGGESGALGIELNELALTFWNLGFQVTTLVSASLNLSPDVVEAVLYGNAGRTGTPTDLSLGGSRGEGFVTTTGAASLAVPLPAFDADMAIGATFKYSVGHFVAVAEETGGVVQSDPLRVEMDFPVLHTDDQRFDDEEVINGSGFGMDLGVQWRRGPLAIGVAGLNVFNSFEWDQETLVFLPGTALLEEGSSETDFDPQPGSAAPAGVRALVTEMKFRPTVAVGVAYDVGRDLTVSADVKNLFGDGLNVGPKLHAGVGAEYRGLRILHLRGGAAVVTRGFQFGGGLSLVLGPVSLSAGASLERGSLEDSAIAQLGLSFGGR